MDQPYVKSAMYRSDQTGILSRFKSHSGAQPENHLLSSLPFDEYNRLLPHLEPVVFPSGKIVYDSGTRPDYVYFPTTAIVALIYITENGATAEMGLVGNDGILGIALFLGGDTAPNRAVVQITGGAVRMRRQVLQQEFARGGPFQNSLLRYTQAFLTQISQTAVCNRLHPIEKRLCRWLLLCRDRRNSDELIMTQELIATILGGRRESVTVAAGHLQDAGLLRYVRGRITIVDRKGLEANACECYQVVKREFDRLLGSREETSHQRVVVSCPSIRLKAQPANFT